ALRFQQVFDTVLDAQTVIVAAGDEAHECPGGLRRGAFRGSEGAVIVAAAALAPSAIGILYGTKPFTAAQDVGFAIALAGRGQAAEGEAGAVNVSHAPASIPAAIGLL